MADQFLLALDQGTTSSRAILYDLNGVQCAVHSEPLAVQFPQNAWVEQSAEEIWQTQLVALKQVTSGISAEQIRAIGITNQRETTIAWDLDSGAALTPAIVWQCRRSAAICQELKAAGQQELVAERSGLVIDAYFSASKIIWLLRNTPGLAQLLKSEKKSRIVFGTIDSWLLYSLTKGRGEKGLGNSSQLQEQAVFATEPSNASRTMLYSLADRCWDRQLLELVGIGCANLAQLKHSASQFGITNILGSPVPITAVLGDQQASLLGHGCITPNSAKCTYGTGAFLLLNTGAQRQSSKSGLLTSPAWVLPENLQLGLAELSQCQTTYTLEGSIFVAGSLIQWLRDGLGIISSAAETEQRASSVSDSCGVVIVPAFVGLGAPYWDPQARGAIVGLTREVSANHIIRASLEAVAHQTADLLDTPELTSVQCLQIDGGMSANNCFNQILADLTGRSIAVAATSEATSLGVARMAGLGAGVFSSLADAVSKFGPSASSATSRQFNPSIPPEQREQARKNWRQAVTRVRSEQ